MNQRCRQNQRMHKSPSGLAAAATIPLRFPQSKNARCSADDVPGHRSERNVESWKALQSSVPAVPDNDAYFLPYGRKHPAKQLPFPKSLEYFPFRHACPVPVLRQQSKKLSEHLSLHTKRQFPLAHEICGRKGIAYQCCHS